MINKKNNKKLYFVYLNDSRKIIGSAVVISTSVASPVPICSDHNDHNNLFYIKDDNNNNNKEENNKKEEKESEELKANKNVNNIKKNNIKEEKVLLGISRIWIDKKYRRQRLATHLLNIIRFTFIPAKEIKLNEISFSSETNSDFSSFLTSFLPSNVKNVYT